MPTSRLVTRVEKILAQTSGEHCVPDLFLLRETKPTQVEALIYDPIVCLILQGKKETTIGEQTRVVAQGQCIVVSHDLPVQARVTEASPTKPYIALAIRLDLAVLRSLYDEIDDAFVETESASAMQVAPVDKCTEDVVGRYLDLFDDPLEARVLLPLVRKELHFRLFRSASGGMLRSLLHRDSHASNIARAITRLRATFREDLEVAELAKTVGMSTSSFHKHFKSVTMTSPLQYQKDLRLTEARRLLRGGTTSVSSTAFQVGYESASQFSREYSRKFGASPRVEIGRNSAQSG